MKIAIFCALRWECRPVLRALRGVSRQNLAGVHSWKGAAAPGDVYLVQTGVGPQRAAEAAAAVAATGSFDLFLSAGCAGALSTDLRPGDLVIGTGVVGGNGRYETDLAFQQAARAACTRIALPVRLGDFWTSPIVLTSPAARRTVSKESGAIAVDMESASIAECAQRYDVPFAVVRAVLDDAELELHEAGDFMDPESGRLRWAEVLRYMATRPGAASHMLALRRMLTRAEATLQKFFASAFRHQERGGSRA